MSAAVQASPSAFWQVPVALQARQAPQLALLQQKPSVQDRPVEHWSLVAQGAPAGFLPHTLPTQVLGATQSALVWQVSRQAVPSHMNGEQGRVVPPTLHRPLPLQVFASVSVEPAAGHMGGAHWVPATCLRHAPAPSHLPSLPQVEAGDTPHVPLGSVAPAPTGEQVPSVADSRHETHGPSHAVLQQTLSRGEHTRPAPHSAVALHCAPLGLRPHDPLMHVALGAQSALAVQVERQTAAPQANGKQEVMAGTVHTPAPLHVPWPVKFTVPAGQADSLHFVPAAYF
jgi:hypothetical protein